MSAHQIMAFFHLIRSLFNQVTTDPVPALHLVGVLPPLDTDVESQPGVWRLFNHNNSILTRRKESLLATVFITGRWFYRYTYYLAQILVQTRVSL